jgi:hypothetical protein
MISTKQRTMAMSALAIVAVLVLFASAPLVATRQARAHHGGGHNQYVSPLHHGHPGHHSGDIINGGY